jgi:hypothetical protein
VEMFDYIYNIANMECIEVPLSIVQMVYVDVELRKEVNWRTIKIQPKLLMIASAEQFIP